MTNDASIVAINIILRLFCAFTGFTRFRQGDYITYAPKVNAGVVDITAAAI